MKHLFVPYELAKLAKEKGFDGNCLATYIEGETGISYILQMNRKKLLPAALTGFTTNAPLYQQLVDWFREKHGIVIQLHHLIPTCYYWSFHATTESGSKLIKKASGRITSRDDYYEALTKALEEAFKLI